MSGSSFGRLLRLSTFGESHGEAIGGTVDGFPSNFKIDFEALRLFVAKRRPGQSKLTTQRKEDDEIEFLSGIFEGKTTGTPIAFLIRNKDAKSKDYDNNMTVYRPSHADFTYDKKYGLRDYRGGGRSSARETVSNVVQVFGIGILSQAGPFRLFAVSRGHAWNPLCVGLSLDCGLLWHGWSGVGG